MNFIFGTIVVISAVILNCGSVNGHYEFPQVHIRTFRPKGFEVSIIAEPGMTLMAFHGQINKKMNGIEAGDISVDITRTQQGRFIYRNNDTKLNRGDKIYFWLHVAFGRVGYNLLDQVHEV